MSDNSPTDAQESALAYINNHWPVAKFELIEDILYVYCDDGGKAAIEPDGSWDWSSSE